MSDIETYGRGYKYSSKFNPQHRRHMRSNSPVGRYRNRMSRDLKTIPRVSEVSKLLQSYQPSRCIGVFGMNPKTTEDTLYKTFSKFGPIERIKMVNFTHTHISRGFCFIYFNNLCDACNAKDTCTGLELDGRRIRVDYASPQRAFAPTPGVYMGRLSRLRKSVSPDRTRER